MRRGNTLLIICFTLFASLTMAQEPDSSEGEETQVFRAEPGLYLTYQDFLTNHPIPPDQIQTTRDYLDRDFYFQLAKERDFSFTDNGVTKTLTISSVWGYCDGKAIFINREFFPNGFLDGRDVSDEKFARINIFGRLSLVFYFKETPPQLNNYGVGTYGVDAGKSKPKELLLDTRDGTFHKANLQTFEKLIADDEELLQEFKNHRKDKDVKLYIYLKKFNERHPFFFADRINSGN
jgi:hypothetical protein